MNTVYIVVQNEYFYQNKVHISFGLALAEESKSGDLSILDTASDLTTDRASIQHLADLCNEQGLSPLHFHEIVQDYLIMA